VGRLAARGKGVAILAKIDDTTQRPAVNTSKRDIAVNNNHPVCSLQKKAIACMQTLARALEDD